MTGKKTLRKTINDIKSLVRSTDIKRNKPLSERRIVNRLSKQERLDIARIARNNNKKGIGK